MAQFFIRRPIVAIVISILTVLMGVITLQGLSVEQYPFLAPPNIRVTANYPGASAEAVEQSVATPIEQEVNGVDRQRSKVAKNIEHLLKAWELQAGDLIHTGTSEGVGAAQRGDNLTGGVDGLTPISVTVAHDLGFTRATHSL